MATLENLVKAFIGESQARNRYTFYAKVAHDEGYPTVSEIFLLTAEQEKQHAKHLMRIINGLKEKGATEITVEAAAPLTLGSTVGNLKAAINGEHYETAEMYPTFAEAAEKEGLKAVAVRLRAIAKAESFHEERYAAILEQLKAGTLFKKKEPVWWVCHECGYVHHGAQPPAKCPSCDHDRHFYGLKSLPY
jgi:rubrerythrin